jgi:hypothetical protein
MKYIVYLATLLLFSTAEAQNPTIIKGDYVSNVFGQSNFVLNPNAQTGIGNISSSSATVTRSTTTPLVATTEFNWNASAGGFSTWSTRPFDAGMKNQNCEARFTYRGFTAGTTTAQVRNSGIVIAELVLTPSATDPRTASINFPCGDLSLSTNFRLLQSGATLGGINEIGGIYVGLATNMANIAQAETVVRARQTAAQTVPDSIRTTILYQTEDLDVYGEYDPTTGIYTAKKTGEYLITASVMSGNVAWSVGEYFEIAVMKNTASNSYCRNYKEMEGNNTANEELLISCIINLQAGENTRITWTHQQGGNISTIGDGSYVFLQIARFPSSSELVVTPETQNVWGSVKYAGSVGEVSVFAGVSPSLTFQTFSSASLASARTVKGKCQPALTSNDLGCSIPNMPVGNYRISVNGEFWNRVPTSGANECTTRIYETQTATQIAGSLAGRNFTDSGLLHQARTIEGVFTNTSVATRNFIVQAAKVFDTTSGSAAYCAVYMNTPANGSDVTLTIEPLDNASNSALYVQGPVKAAGTGTAIPAGYQFEELTGTSVANFSMISGNSYKLAQITLQPGLYLLEGRAYLSNNATISVFRLDISTNNGSVLSTFESGSDGANGANNARSLIRFFRVTSAQTYYLNGYVIWSGTFVNFIGSDSFLKAYRLN